MSDAYITPSMELNSLFIVAAQAFNVIYVARCRVYLILLYFV